MAKRTWIQETLTYSGSDTETYTNIKDHPLLLIAYETDFSSVDAISIKITRASGGAEHVLVSGATSAAEEFWSDTPIVVLPGDILNMAAGASENGYIWLTFQPADQR